VVTLGSSIKREVFSDGTSRELRSEPGTVKWMDSGRRATENESDEALEELEIELKRANAPAAIVSPRSSGAPLLEEPMPANREPHHRLNYENQYIRVLEVTLQPGESSLFHTHSTDVVIVTLSEALARSQEKGNAWEAERAGMVSVDRAVRTPHTHHLQNVGTTVFRTLNIEILPVLP
jgi:quercetin dioxygenase-like cupin family protein